jgi:hypothetical protein
MHTFEKVCTNLPPDVGCSHLQILHEDRNCMVGGGGGNVSGRMRQKPQPTVPDLPTCRVSTAGMSTARRRLPEPTERGSG